MIVPKSTYFFVYSGKVGQVGFHWDSAAAHVGGLAIPLYFLQSTAYASIAFA
jgi:hypothetical protein